MSYKLGNTNIVNPSSFSIDPFTISKPGQTASGKATREVIARKRKFTLQWEMLYGSDYQTILGAADDATFFTFTFLNNGTTATATVYVDGGVKGTLINQTGVYIYAGVELVLIEQ